MAPAKIMGLSSLAKKKWVKRVNPAEMPNAGCNAVAYSTYNKRLVYAEDASPYVDIYDLNGEYPAKFYNPNVLPTGLARCIDLSYDGSVLAVGGNTTPYINVYDFFGGLFTKRANIPNPPTWNVYGICISGDGTVVAASGTANTSYYPRVARWEVNKWISVTVTGLVPTEGAYSICMNEEGTRMFVGTGTGGDGTRTPISIYDQTSNTAFARISEPANFPLSIVRGVDCSADGSIFATAQQMSPFVTAYIRIGTSWVARSFSGLMPTAACYSVALSADASVLAVGGIANSPVMTYEWDGNSYIFRDSIPQIGDVKGCALSAAGDSLFLALTATGGKMAMYDWK